MPGDQQLSVRNKKCDREHNAILTAARHRATAASKDMAIEATPEVLNSLLAKLGAPACYKVGTTFMESVYGLWR